MYTQRSYWSILCVNWMMVELREYENTKHQYKALQNWHDLKERLSTISLFTNLRHSAITTDQHTPVCRLGKQAKHARHTHERWLARATSPLSYILLRSPGITIATTLVAFQRAPKAFIFFKPWDIRTKCAESLKFNCTHRSMQCNSKNPPRSPEKLSRSQNGGQFSPG